MGGNPNFLIVYFETASPVIYLFAIYGTVLLSNLSYLLHALRTPIFPLLY